MQCGQALTRNRNAAYILGIRSIAYALAAGNTAILKAPEFSPRCSWAIHSCLAQAGLPAGVLNTIAHRTSDAAAVTSALIADPRIKKINFTGSTLVGRIIAKTAGEHLKPVLLELGGKAPAIVWEDADLDLAATECAKGALIHVGQICMSTEKILVHKSVAAAFEALLKQKVEAMFGQAGVLVNKAGVDRNRRLVADAVSKGAELLVGTLEQDHQAPGTHMSPIVVKKVTPAMALYQTESFGPTVSVIEVESEDEAVRVANDTEYGLTSAVFTEDLRRGLRFARRIESGAVHINGMTVHDETMLPHGGVKSSGYGRFGSSGLEEWVQTKTVTFRN
jgi:acyl-CoA reductase-like NAD-dependent aldehyde dehydrogenase